MKIPHGWDEILTVYGDIRSYIKPDGTLRPEWEWHALDTVGLPGEIPLGWDHSRKVSRIRCHRLIAPMMHAAFESIKASDLWPKLRTFDGCFAFRPQRGSSGKLSLHAFGAAIDLNAATNQLGEAGDMDGGIVECFESVGFRWGGRFGRPDPMHWQAAAAY